MNTKPQKTHGIGEKIRQLRSIFGKTQKDFAEELDATQANISQIESGECIPTGNFFLRLAEKFPETNFNWIYYSDGSPLRTQDAFNKKHEITNLKKTFLEVNKENERLKNDNSKLINLMSSKRSNKN